MKPTVARRIWKDHSRIKPRNKLNLHAESNALSKMLRAGMSTLSADVFVTHAPCIECAKILAQAGVRSVTFGIQYRDNAGINFLKKTGVIVEQYVS